MKLEYVNVIMKMTFLMTTFKYIYENVENSND